MTKLSVDVWSDIACPWCYIGKRRLEGALAGMDGAEDVEIRWHAFELDPSAPKVREHTKSQAERISEKYRVSVAQAQVMVDRVAQAAAGDGLDFQMEKVVGGNTFDAHRLLHLAGERGAALQGALKERLLRAYFTEGRAIGDSATLVALAVEAGLDAAEVADVLATDRYAAEVRADEAAARELGITGVPFFVIDGRLGVSGAQPADVLRAALQQARRDAASRSDAPAGGAGGAEASGDGDGACGPGGCELTT